MARTGIVNIVSIRYYVPMNEMNESEDLQRSLERVSSLLRHELRETLIPLGLQAVQFEVLDYIARCNRYSDTPMALTEYLGQTKGSVSQTLKVLEKNALIEKVADSEDKRVVHLSLTAAGRRVRNKVFPSRVLGKSTPALGKEQLRELNATLIELLRALQAQNNRRSFGQCFSCEHHIETGKNKYQCGLTGEALGRTDIKLICREHSAVA
ncbi:MAG: transcriptional regulator [Pseudohongiella sp.]|nr:MAG: transcriptional regulator [Pseudohongiella sp.]